MDKLAEIGTTITWVIATFLLLFIMYLYTVGVGSIAVSGLGKSQVNVETIEENFYQTEKLISFLELNKEKISAWADNEKTIVYSNQISGEIDEDLSKIYSELGDSADEFIKDYESGYFCFILEDKTLIVDGKGYKDFSWRVLPPSSNCVKAEGTYNELFIISNGGKLVRVIYQDESNFGL